MKTRLSVSTRTKEIKSVLKTHLEHNHINYYNIISDGI